jgi:hypothetical protein
MNVINISLGIISISLIFIGLFYKRQFLYIGLFLLGLCLILFLYNKENDDGSELVKRGDINSDINKQEISKLINETINCQKN